MGAGGRDRVRLRLRLRLRLAAYPRSREEYLEGIF